VECPGYAATHLARDVGPIIGFAHKLRTGCGQCARRGVYARVAIHRHVVQIAPGIVTEENKSSVVGVMNHRCAL